MKKIHFLGVIAVIFYSKNVLAADYQDAGEFSIRPLVASVRFDHKRDLQNADGVGIGLGYYFTPNLTTELNFFSYSAKQKKQLTNKNTHGQYYFLNMLYYFRADYALQPFLTGGIGGWHTNQSLPNQNQSQGMLNAGLGLAYFIKDNISLRLGGNDFYSITQGGYNDLSGNFGVNILIGKDENTNDNVSPNDASLIESPAPIPSKENNYLLNNK